MSQQQPYQYDKDDLQYSQQHQDHDNQNNDNYNFDDYNDDKIHFTYSDDPTNQQINVQQQHPIPQKIQNEDNAMDIEYDNKLQADDVEGISEMDEMLQKREKHEADDLVDGMTEVHLDRILFSGIVELCKTQKLIDEDIAHIFQTNYTISQAKKYIELYRSNQLSQYNYDKCKLTIMDHRRLSQMLVQHKQKYISYPQPQTPYDFVRDVQQFLKQIYQMEETRYYQLVNYHALVFNLTWWGGPPKLTPLVDPPVKFYQTSEGRSLRVARETVIPIESREEELQRIKRLQQRRGTKTDLTSIADQLALKYFNKAPVKLEGEKQILPDMEVESQRETRSEKEKKNKKEKKSKKSKKNKNKKNKKKSHHEDEVKEQAQSDGERQAKEQADLPYVPTVRHKSSHKSKKK